MTREQLPACPYCEAGRLLYDIATGNFACDRCYAQVPWTVELDRAFCKSAHH